MIRDPSPLEWLGICLIVFAGAVFMFVVSSLINSESR